jgi:hypothetical protein
MVLEIAALIRCRRWGHLCEHGTASQRQGGTLAGQASTVPLLAPQIIKFITV